ncbi:hypothetical protein HRI_003793400 [Hibiscus trionum]|uniref:Endonuclease/exonuclease/phosphatase domain-containing protein n=1 Tax=Hibiscus trionum TaxID=183268 RepID=A0A9W7MI07_HIBTR|nr:hypothetical protein HRI_003793400 [Hibiscus trionum]
MNSTYFLSWNTRGLGSRIKRGAVKKVVVRLKPGVIFIQESKKKLVDIIVFSQICGQNQRYSFAFSPSIGASGGLVSCWDEDFFSLKQNIIHSRFIASVGTIRPLDMKCVLVNVYALNNHSDRNCLWIELKEIITRLKLPVVIGGDFNIVRRQSEKLGVYFHKKAMNEFEDFIEELALIDLPFSGGAYTWCSNREAHAFCRLDRFLLTADMLLKWLELIQKLCVSSISDHKPVILCNNIPSREPKPFRWFDYWTDEEGFENVVKIVVTKAEGKGIGNILQQCKIESSNWLRCKKEKNIEDSKALEKKDRL